MRVATGGIYAGSKIERPQQKPVRIRPRPAIKFLGASVTSCRHGPVSGERAGPRILFRVVDMPKSMPREIPPRLPAAPESVGVRSRAGNSRKKQGILFRFVDLAKPAEVRVFRLETDISLSAEDIVDAVVMRERAISRGRRLLSTIRLMSCVLFFIGWCLLCYWFGCLLFGPGAGP